MFSIWKVRKDQNEQLLKPFVEWTIETRSGDLVEMPLGFHEECKRNKLALARCRDEFRSVRIAGLLWGDADGAVNYCGNFHINLSLVCLSLLAEGYQNWANKGRKYLLSH